VAGSAGASNFELGAIDALSGSRDCEAGSFAAGALLLACDVGDDKSGVVWDDGDGAESVAGAADGSVFAGAVFAGALSLDLFTLFIQGSWTLWE
jgi:hypothetical protein